MSLDENARKRKERLAQLQATKRKHSALEDTEAAAAVIAEGPDEADDDEPALKLKVARNYDMETKLPKLGFLNAGEMTGAADTVENRSKALIAEAEAAQEDGEEDAPLDLEQLQPKKPDWDLKRDLEARMEPLRKKEQQVIDGLVRERIRAAKAGGTKQIDGSAMLRQSNRLEAQAHEV
ncbi:mRNA splicing factor [Protomyces lactucae-debilis]|uniref:mRNA splicing factor n=1 Tax=Protomyces lactucae-debilis TaxID=2754530 RepID=A0A1Y2FIN0_PROLT|nr:mRNA splicing factor [Protomyces lactucae-debilis]ORY83106.1 mRNA splicing factor [Protomyces lactucae-debilis]